MAFPLPPIEVGPGKFVGLVQQPIAGGASFVPPRFSWSGNEVQKKDNATAE